MITKETFIEVITKIKEEDERNNSLSIFLEENVIDGYATLKESISRKCIWIILEDIFTEEGSDLINWWIYEDVEKYLYEKSTGKVLVDLTNLESLYDYLVENYTKSERKEKFIMDKVLSDSSMCVVESYDGNMYEYYKSIKKVVVVNRYEGDEGEIIKGKLAEEIINFCENEKSE